MVVYYVCIMQYFVIYRIYGYSKADDPVLSAALGRPVAETGSKTGYFGPALWARVGISARLSMARLVTFPNFQKVTSRQFFTHGQSHRRHSY